MVIKMVKKLVYGAGINDANYQVYTIVNGKQVKCPYYSKWQGMLERCYSAKYQAKHQTYIGCYVCKEWLTFSNFKLWMETQDWEGRQLDKDILTRGNKSYSPETCVFVSPLVNTFITESAAARGYFPLGVNLHKSAGKFKAQCSNPFKKKVEHLGLFVRPNEAHQAWKRRKHQLAVQLADLQVDERVAKALKTWYL